MVCPAEREVAIVKHCHARFPKLFRAGSNRSTDLELAAPGIALSVVEPGHHHVLAAVIRDPGNDVAIAIGEGHHRHLGLLTTGGAVDHLFLIDRRAERTGNNLINLIHLTGY